MRRISDLKARIKRTPVCQEASRPLWRVPCDLAYLMSRHDRRIRRLCRYVSPCKVSVLAPWKKSYERSVFYEARAAFDVDLRPFVNLRVLSVRDSSLFDILLIGGTGVKKLSLHGVLRVSMARALAGTILEEVSLRGTKIAYEDLMRMLEIESLVSVSLENVEVVQLDGRGGRLLEKLREMPRLRRLELVGMGVGIQCFTSLCISKGLTCFKVSEGDACLDVRLWLFASVIRCVNTLKYLTAFDVGTVESMYVWGGDLKDVREELPSLRLLHATQAEVDSKVARAVYLRRAGLVGLGFVGCTFVGTSFYEVVAHFRSSLRHLDLMSSNLPHDYVSFLERSLLSCSVRLKGGEVVEMRQKP